VQQRSDLVCIVLSVGNPPHLVAAVKSLLDQSHPVDVLVVNSGGGNAAASLAPIGVEAVDVEERLLPGGARNLGIATLDSNGEVRHPFVAFLACDSIAEPGWAAARLGAHRDGALAVACSVTNLYPRSIAAWTSHVALMSRRMPGTPANEALKFGLSYARPLFDHYGKFRDDLRGGEDTEFNGRLAEHVAIRWVPSVRTAHRNPRTVRAMMYDQYRRGMRAAVAAQNLGGSPHADIAKAAVKRMRGDFARALRAAERGQKRWIIASAALLPAAEISYAVGAMRARTRTVVHCRAEIDTAGSHQTASVSRPTWGKTNAASSKP
jgi:hypothetical protein